MAHVQSTSESSYSATTTHTLAFSSGVTAGSFLVAAIRENNSVSAVSDDVNGSWTELIDLDNTVVGLNVWYKENAGAGPTTVTVTTSTGGQTLRYGIAEYSDAPSSSAVDDYDSASFTTTTTPSTASLTTTGANRTIISVIATNLSATSIAPAGGESERQEVDARFQFQDEFAATAGSHGASWTLGATQPGVYAILALKPATTTTKYVKILADSPAASATGVEVVVYSAPSGSNYITGTTRYGSVNAQEFEAALESGSAVLKVLATDVGCGSLAAATTVAALARNTTYTTGMVEATIIEE